MEFTPLQAKTASQASGMQQSGHWRSLLMRRSVAHSGFRDIRNELHNWGHNVYRDHTIEMFEDDMLGICNPKASL